VQAMGYRHAVRVRYGECDMQQVVFNANYLAYIDDAVDTWFREVFDSYGSFEELGFDFMVKKISLEWQSPARFGETLELDCHVSRWGTTSFDVTVRAGVGERPVLDALLVYVSTAPGQAKAVPVPDLVRQRLAAP
jgi:acyl-CoA thioester hydrolase